MDFAGIRRAISEYYTAKVTVHGATPCGVDWNSPQSQFLRFEKLMSVTDGRREFSINDYGCGYGALLQFLHANHLAPQYTGFDLAEAMIVQAVTIHGANGSHRFSSREEDVGTADYTVASGIFNVKLAATPVEWRDYILETLNKLCSISSVGFAFNMLTSYSHPERMRDTLYYGDPCFFFDYSKRYLSPNVALLHDYGLHDFTIVIRK